MEFKVERDLPKLIHYLEGVLENPPLDENGVCYIEFVKSDVEFILDALETYRENNDL